MGKQLSKFLSPGTVCPVYVPHVHVTPGSQDTHRAPLFLVTLHWGRVYKLVVLRKLELVSSMSHTQGPKKSSGSFCMGSRHWSHLPCPNFLGQCY